MSIPYPHLIAELKAVPTARKTRPEKQGPNPCGHSRRRLLIADNDSLVLDTTRDFFEDTEYDIITVKSAQAARLISYFMAQDLDAVILDGRLTDDAEPNDRSGYALANEMLDSFEYFPPIIIYSLYQRPGEPERDGITFVLKDGTDRIVDEVGTAIEKGRFRPQARVSPRGATPPVVILDDQRGAADLLRRELGNYDIDAATCADLNALIEAAPRLPSAVFIVYVDGPERLEAIRRLKRLPGQTSYVAAFVDREEQKKEAAQVGPDVILVKDSAETDALELDTRMRLYRIESAQAALGRPVTKLALIYYKKLVEQLEEIKESPGYGMAEPLRTVGRALDLPSLTAQEQLVLTSLDTWMRTVGARPADDSTIQLCIDGAKMLADERASRSDVRGWSERALRHSPDFAPLWVSEEAFEELFDDDTEWEDE
jgi:DNA-binding NarL/FixJ family response regulator